MQGKENGGATPLRGGGDHGISDAQGMALAEFHLKMHP